VRMFYNVPYMCRASKGFFKIKHLFICMCYYVLLIHRSWYYHMFAIQVK